MKLIITEDGHYFAHFKKNLRFSSLFLTLLVFLFASKPIYAFDSKINLNLKAEPLSEVLKKIEEQTKYSFVYSLNHIDLNQKVTLTFRNARLKEVLAELSVQSSLKYTLQGRHILITKQSEKSKNQSETPTQSVSNMIPQSLVDGTIRGVVTEEGGSPLVGVSVMLKGTTIGTTTDLDGKFNLNVPDDLGVLVFSFIGYQTLELKLESNRTDYNVSLSEDNLALSEVVVVGYGTQKKVSLTGSIAVAKGEEIKQSPAVNLTNSLAGRLPGIITKNSSGLPGSGSTLLIRGQSTLGNNNPLIVIDGVWGRDGLDEINPNDIESISVLKDAAAAIYGAQAANGVILVTTKRGLQGKPVISYTGNLGLSSPTRLPKMSDAATYAEFMNELYQYQGQPGRFNSDEIEKLRNGSDPIRYPNTNWAKESLRNVATQTQHNLSLRGGSEAITYYLSGSYSEQNDILKSNFIGYDNYSIRSNIDAKVNENIKVGLNFAMRSENSNMPSMGTTSIFHTMWRNYPFLLARNPDGSFAPGIERGENPLVMGTEEAGYNKTRDNLYQTTFTYEVNIPWVRGLSVDGFVANDKNYSFNKLFRKPWMVYEYNPDEDTYSSRVGGSVTSPQLTQTQGHYNRTTLNLRLKYDWEYKNHFVNAFVAVEQTETKGNSFWAQRKNYITSAIDELFAGGATDKDNSGSAYETARQNLFGRVSYNLKETYLIDFNFRYDGSQNFPKEKRFGFFPGISVGWRLSEESFLEDVDILDELKLRGSWGQMGNDQISSFQYLSTYSFGTSYRFANPTTTVIRGTSPNLNITWEIAQTMNLGANLSMWRGLLDIEVDVFKTKRNNILTARNASVPAYTGLKLPNENIGVVENKGFEIQVNHNNRYASLPYFVGFNMSYARNKIIDIDEAINQQYWQMRTGYAMNTSLYYDAIGIFRSEEEINGHPHPVGTRVGDLKYRDVNDDGLIDAKDRIRVDYTNIPRVMLGLNMGIQHKNLSIQALWQGATAVKQYIFLQAGLAGNILQDWADNRYTPENPNSKFPILPTYEAEISGYRSTFWLKDASYIRLKNLEIAYNIPPSILETIKLRSARVYVNGFNLLTFDKLKYFDPEGTSETGGFYPQQKIYNVGLNISF